MAATRTRGLDVGARINFSLDTAVVEAMVLSLAKECLKAERKALLGHNSMDRDLNAPRGGKKLVRKNAIWVDAALR